MGVLCKQKGMKIIDYSNRLADCACPICKETFRAGDVIVMHKSKETGNIVSTNLGNQRAITPTVTTKIARGNQARDFLKQSLRGDLLSSKQLSILSSLEDTWRLDPGSNVVIFSQYLGFLDLLATSLSSRQIEYF